MSIFKEKPQRSVFIVSTGRTGTTALATHLNEIYPDVYAVHEPSPSYRLRRCSNMALSGRITREELAKKLAASRTQAINALNKNVYIESNPFLHGFIEAFGDVFNKPKIVHIVRDPRTYIQSAINFGSFAKLKFFAQALVPYWMPKPDNNINNPAGLRWSQMSNFKRLAWSWKRTNEDLNRGAAIYGPDYCLIKFEDLFAKDGSGLKKFIDFTGLQWDPKLQDSSNSKKVNASEPKRVPKWKEWPKETLDEIYELCGPLMNQYGYAIS